MGQLKRQTLGDVFGAVGHLVFKNRGGINYISHKPVSYATPQDPRSVLIRNQFRMTSKLSKSINSIDFLKKIWENKYPNSYSIYHKIFNDNYHHLKSDTLSGDLHLTPDFGFKLYNPEIELSANKLIFKADPVPHNSGMDPLKNNFIVAASLLIFRYSDHPDSPPVFQPFKGIITPLDLTQPVFLTTEIHSPEAIVPDDEYVFRSWSVLIILDEKLNPVCYSQTIPWSSIPRM